MRSLRLLFAVLLIGPVKAAPRASALTRTVGTARDLRVTQQREKFT
jgi:hypothetical protein